MSRPASPPGEAEDPGEAVELPDVAYAVALAALGDMTPARLRALLTGLPAAHVFEQLRSSDSVLVERLARLWEPAPGSGSGQQLLFPSTWGASGSTERQARARAEAGRLVRGWRSEAASMRVAWRWRELARRGITVVRRGEAAYPRRLLRARPVPELLYVRGRLEEAEAPCVGIVGTRRATHYGLEVAAELGRELAARGVVIVSGLARGIDAAAHGGALAAGRGSGLLAVVGGGVDVVYPRENRRLWEEVVGVGGVVSEAPPGAPPESWRFPLRNRIIAALSQVLVVVESSRQGGAMHTVAAADAYGVAILAVPGSVRSPQSEGTNAIIQEGGAGVALDVHDVLAALAMACEEDGTAPAVDPRRRTPASPSSTPRRSRNEASAGLSPSERAVLGAVEHTPTLTDLVCRRAELDLGAVALALDHLEELGLVRSEGATWVRR